MSITSRQELKELYLQEVESYIPEIRSQLAVLHQDEADLSAIQELHRLFHNIRGASSQVKFLLLSKGVRNVENILSDLLDGELPISGAVLRVINDVTGLLFEFVTGREQSGEREQLLHEQITHVCQEAVSEAGLNSVDSSAGGTGRNLEEPGSEGAEWLHSVRSVLPLLQELGACLSTDEQDEDYNRLVYGKISHAVSILVACSGATGMLQQYQLMENLHQLVQRLSSKAVSHHHELVGLVQDFLQFLEVVFSHPDPENSRITERIKKQLQIFHLLLSGRQALPDSPDTEESVSGGETNLFDEPLAENEIVDFLEHLDGADLSVETGMETDVRGEVSQVSVVPAESPEEEIDEDQQILMEIFRSECEEHLIVINQSLNSLESDVAELQPLSPELLETVNTMRRAVHTLKGAAAMTGVNLLARGAHKLEDMLDYLYDDSENISPEDVSILGSSIDVIELLSQTPQDQESEHLDKMVASLSEYLDIRSPASLQVVDESGELSGSDDFEPEQERAQVQEQEQDEVVPFAAGDLEDEDDGELDVPGLSGTLRVKLEDLDELVSIEGELVVARGAMEKVVDEFGTSLAELDTVKENLRRKSQELEAGFEVQSLYGLNPAMGGGDGQIDGELAEFDPIELDRYSQLNLIIRSLNEISVDVNAISTTMTSLAGEIRGQVTKQQLTMRLMQDKLMRIRMTPMSSISRILFRTVRETARELGKNVNLTVSGEDVYMDRFVWAKITDPLMHVLRNAVDHGIEPAGERTAAGKPAVGTIYLEAEQRSRYVVLRVSDDGGGIQLSMVREKLKRQGLVEDPDSLSEQELIDYLFHSSFSTKKDVSTISGRGVGLDVVKKNVQELKGSVELINKPGQGVTFEFQIPFTLSVNRAILVSVAGKQFAVPLQDIHHVGHFAKDQISSGDGLSLVYEDETVVVTNMSYYLQLAGKADTVPEDQDGMLVILFNVGDDLVGAAVDTVVEQREIIVKDLGNHLTHVHGVSGVTVTGTGELIPILNLRELVELPESGGDAEVAAASGLILDEPLKVLIVDDSISVRHSVARLIESQSWVQQQAVDGMDALAKLEVFVPDVIILDIEMPRMNGYEFKAHINNNPLWVDIPIIMLTSRASEKHQQKAKELGIDLYMTKPYQDTAFIQMLEDIRNS